MDSVVRLKGFKPLAPSFGGMYSIQLSYRRRNDGVPREI